jgi:capsular exopolysaccharide synthesis family protein
MSQIFDALLRSEAERTGTDRSTQAGATELLRNVERQAESRWASGTLFDLGGGTMDAENAVRFGQELASRPSERFDTNGHAQAMGSDKTPNVFSQFRQLSVTLSSESRLVCLTDKASPTAEAFRLLGVRLRNLRRARPLQKLLITSTVPREGKSTLAANLAFILSQKQEEKILLLEGDVRRPSLTQMFELSGIPGICELLQGKCSLAQSIYRLEEAGPWILPAGSAPNAPLELLQSEKLSALMDQLSSWFDWIVIDSPPALPLADTSVWARTADGILLVTRQGVTEKQQLERGIHAIETGKLIGAVLNCSKVSSYSSYYYRSSAAS